MPSLSLHVSASFDRIVVMVVGDLDHDTCPRIREVTDAVSIRNRIVRLDLAGVAFMDASGLGLLQKLQRYTHAQGGLLELSGLQPEPRRVLELTGTLTRFHVTAGPGTPLRLPTQRAAS
ncbi:STAS domain-containing protein [Streptomyces actinomycinicus]|uniref:Anti-sigma factor antagonist n=1 Tax=Streptomyces actinomycinicus TaxID=1695166 RepID=A0A937JNS8_9ACTN|nr:STAS domain-containing protein [Streptomyces actinomycinicus]MBL1083651.1 STAS domain-containing protein [Streptomyces actinomycinicus]